MLFLATFFPMSDMEEEEGEHQFDFLNDFLRATVDIADLVGIYLVMSRVAGKGSVKVLVAGLGWGFAELVLTRLVFLWVGARGVEFDWRYIQKSFEVGQHHRNGSGGLCVIIWFQGVIDGIRGNGLVSVVMPGISRVRPIRPLFQTIVNAGAQLIQRIGHHIGSRGVMSRSAGDGRY